MGDWQPDVGAARAAEMLAGRLGIEVTADGVEELARRGLIAAVRVWKKHVLYAVTDLETVTDPAVVQAAEHAGQTRTAAQAAAYLQIRRTDLDHLTRVRLLRPARYGFCRWDRRNRPSVPLYRTGDLDDLLASPRIDWAAVRATPRGRPSPIIQRIALEERALAALAG